MIAVLCLAGIGVLSEVRSVYGQTQLWSFPTGSAARHVLMSADGSKVVVGTDSGVVYEFSEGELRWSYNTDSYIRSIDMPDDGRYVAVASQNGNLYFLNGDDGALSSVMNIGPIAIDATPDGDYLAVLQPGPFVLWFSGTGAIIGNFTMPIFSAEEVSISDDGSYVAVSGERYVQLLRREDATGWRHTGVNPNASVLCVHVSASYVAYGTSDNNVEVRDVSGALLWSTSTDDQVSTVQISADQKYIVAGTYDQLEGSGPCSVYLIDRVTGSPLWSYPVSDLFGNAVYNVAISPDNLYVVACSPTALHFLDGSTGALLSKYNPGTSILSVSIASNGGYFVVGASSGVIAFSVPVDEYSLSAAVDGSGYTDPSVGVSVFEAGSEISVTAYPDSGWLFSHWLLDGVNVGTGVFVDSQHWSYTVVMDANHNLTAVFYPVSERTLTIEVRGSGITVPAAGFYTFDVGASLVVEAFPDVEWNFSRWELDGVNVGNTASQSVVMDSNHVLVAVFAETRTSPPSISMLDWNPRDPVENQEVAVRFSILGEPDDLAGVTFWYRVSGGEWIKASVNFDGETWTATIPGQKGGATIDFYIECSDNLGRNVISNNFSYEVKPPETSLSLLLMMTLGGTGVTAASIGLYRVYWPGRSPSSCSLERQLREENSKEKEKEEREDEEEEKKRARKKGRPWLKLAVDFPKKVMKSSSDDIKVKLRNVGTASAKNIKIEVDSSGSLVLGKEAGGVPELKPLENSPTITFPLKGSEQFRRGKCRLEFSYRSKQTRKRVSQRYLRAVKIGLINDQHKPESGRSLESWLKRNGYAWDNLTSCDDLVSLLRYDLLLVSPEFECTKKGVENLSRFVERGQSLLFVNKIVSSEQEALANMMGYQQVQYEPLKSREGTITISKDHFVTKSFAEGEKINLGSCGGELCTSKPTDGEVLAFQTLACEKQKPEITIPAITVNRYGLGRTLHLNVPVDDFLQKFDTILKMAIDWLLFQDESLKSP